MKSVAASSYLDGRDPRDVGTYTVAEAAAYLHVPSTTLREWVTGKTRVIAIDPRRPPMLTFWNLVEAYVLASLRRHHRVSLQRVRRALRYVQREMGTERPLLDEDFQTDGVSLFVSVDSGLVNASQEGQVAMREILSLSLRRVERDPRGLVQRIFPWLTDATEPRDLEIDPTRAFGRLVVAGTGIPAATIAGRFRAGDSLRVLEKDYGLTTEQVSAALRWHTDARTY